MSEQNQKRTNASNVATAQLTGYIISEPQIGTTASDKKYVYFLMSGEGEINYSIRCTNERTMKFIEEHVKKGCLVNVLGEPEGFKAKSENYKAVIYIRAKSFDLLAKADGEQTSQQQSQQQSSGGWGQPQQSAAPQQSHPQQAPVSEEAPMDFDDDIPF